MKGIKSYANNEIQTELSVIQFTVTIVHCSIAASNRHFLALVEHTCFSTQKFDHEHPKVHCSSSRSSSSIPESLKSYQPLSLPSILKSCCLVCLEACS